MSDNPTNWPEFVTEVFDWQPDDDPKLWGRLQGSAYLVVRAGTGTSVVPIHLSAYEVAMRDDSAERSGATQRPANDDAWSDEFDAMATIYEGDGPWNTVTIKGKEYVVNAVPFC